MTLLIPFVLLLCIWKEKEFRERWIYASVIWAVFAYVSTEFLSLFSLITKETVSAAWIGFSILLLFLLCRIYRKENIRKIISVFHFGKKDDFFSVLCLFVLEVIFIGTCLVAIKSVPNNWDSLAYHLPRIEHWIQNKNINFFPTHIPRQLYMWPLSEILMLQIRLLISVTSVHFIQWFAMIGSIFSISYIAKKIGMNKELQYMTAVIAATIPMGILQSTSTKNDYLLSFWLVCSAYFFMLLMRNKNRWNMLFFGVACGLAIQTQPIAAFYITPLFIYLSKEIVERKIKLILLVPLFFSILFLTAPHIIRTYQLYGNYTGPEANIYVIQSFEPKYIVSNMIKNISVHFSSFDKVLNQQIYNAVAHVHSIMGVDINTPITTWNFATFEIHTIDADEDYAGNFIHFCLILISSVYVFLGTKRKQNIHFFTPVIVGWLLSIIFLKNQPWISRFQLPFFILMAPMIALCFKHTKKICIYGVVMLVSISSMYFVCMNKTRPIIGPDSILLKTDEQIMFAKQPKLLQSYKETIFFLKKHELRKIGVYFFDDTWEYPLWYMLRNVYGNGFFMEHVDVDNVSNYLFDKKSVDVVICIQCTDDIYSEERHRKIQFGAIDVIPFR